MKYTKKPVTIEAVQYDGNFRCLDIFSINEVGKFELGKEDDGTPYLLIPTLEGKMKCSKGDYVIRGVKGEYYPCKPDIFEMTYEQAAPPIKQSTIDTNKVDVEKFIKEQLGLPEYIEISSLGPIMESQYNLALNCYNKAKENLYTEDDVKQAYEWGSNASLGVSKTNLIKSLKK